MHRQYSLTNEEKLLLIKYGLDLSLAFKDEYGYIDYYGDVNFRYSGYKTIDIKFGKVYGCFDIEGSDIESLKNCPYYVNNYFECSSDILNNPLELLNLPIIVDDELRISVGNSDNASYKYEAINKFYEYEIKSLRNCKILNPYIFNEIINIKLDSFCIDDTGFIKGEYKNPNDDFMENTFYKRSKLSNIKDD